MSPEKFSVSRPVTVLMIFSALILFGVMSIPRMDIDLLPLINYPQLSVITPYSGASPTDIETLITRPVEEAVNGVSGVVSVKSESIEGASLVTARFGWGTDVDMAAVRIREKVDMIRGILPEDSGKSIVARYDLNSEPVMRIVATGTAPIENITETVEVRIKPRFERVDGVGSIKISGGLYREVKVNIDPMKLFSYNTGIDEIIKRINISNYSYPAGTAVKGDKEYLIRTIGEFKSLKDVEETVVKRDKQGRQVLVRDLASVTYGYKERTGKAYYNGKECVNISVIKEAGKNSVRVCENVSSLVDELNKNSRDGMKFEVVYDGSELIKNSIIGVSMAALQGAIISFFIILLFLKDIRNSFIISTMLPVCVIITLLLMYAKGVTLNMMSLGGLALGIGMLIDNGIIVMETVQHEEKHRKGIIYACIEAVKQIKTPLLASTLASVVVFLPVFFIKGIAGEFFSELAFSVSVSLIVAYVVSITLIPAMIVLFYKEKSKKSEAKSSELLTMIWEKIDKTLNKIEKKYFVFLQVNLKKFRLFLIAGGAALGIGLFIFLFLGFSFFPESQGNIVSVRITAPPGTPLAETSDIAISLDKIISSKKWAVTRLIEAGYNQDDITRYFGKEKALYTAEILVTVKKGSGIDAKKAAEIIKRDAGILNNVKIETGIPHRELAALAGLVSSDMTIDVFGEDLEELKKSAYILSDKLKATGKFTSVSPVISEGKPEIKIDIDKRKMASFGLVLSDVAETVRSSVSGGEAGGYYGFERRCDILVKPLYSPGNENLLSTVALKNAEGKVIPLESFSNLKHQTGYMKIVRKEQKRCVNVSISAGGTSFSQIESLIKKVKLPEGITASLSSEAVEGNDSINQVMIFALVSVILIYMILASQFESLRKPVIIMLSVPMTIFGISLALLITGNSVNIISGMGMIMLAGLAVNNGILLFEKIQRNRDEGMELEKSILGASKDRLKPIIISTVVTMLDILPLALGLQEGSEMQSPLAIAVIGGLISSTILILVVLPSYYYKMESQIK